MFMKKLIRKFNYIKYRNIREMRNYFAIYTLEDLPFLIESIIIFAIIVMGMLFVYIKAMSLLGKV
jgi:hypothetical protein